MTKDFFLSFWSECVLLYVLAQGIPKIALNQLYLVQFGSSNHFSKKNPWVLKHPVMSRFAQHKNGRLFQYRRKQKRRKLIRNQMNPKRINTMFVTYVHSHFSPTFECNTHSLFRGRCLLLTVNFSQESSGKPKLSILLRSVSYLKRNLSRQWHLKIE